MRVLALTTYPVKRPVHGGQRRVRALGELYVRLGAEFASAGVFTPHYGSSDVGPYDIPLGAGAREWDGVPFVEDLQSGVFASQSPGAYNHFVRTMETFRPDILSLEHPFLWPLIRRLKDEGRLKDVRVIYSSHNWEAPLKQTMLVKSGLSPDQSRRIAEAVLTVERAAVKNADLILTVSEQDAAIYREEAPGTPVVVAPNGVDEPMPLESARPDLLWHFGERPFMFFVGSAYPPNIEGFTSLVCPEGMFFVPPEKRFAICGGVCDPLFARPEYQCFLGGNSARAHFFPGIDDEGLSALKSAAHAFLLPITFGGGSNLKTAEALLSGKWVVTTSLALRGFDAFRDAPGVLVADTPSDFRRAMIRVLASPPLELRSADAAARASLTWQNGFRRSGAEAYLARFLDGAIQISTP